MKTFVEFSSIIRGTQGVVLIVAYSMPSYTVYPYYVLTPRYKGNAQHGYNNLCGLILCTAPACFSTFY